MKIRVSLLILLGVTMAALCQSSSPTAPVLDQSATGIRYSDFAGHTGILHSNTYGGRNRKDYILETTGNGAAIFDFDGDGWSDLLFTNGRTLEQDEANQPAALVLYRNDGTGRFSDITAKAGLETKGWAQGLCVGDFDNDGHPGCVGDVLWTQSSLQEFWEAATSAT